MILALDPGTTQTGWCVYCDCGTPECGVRGSGVMSNDRMLDYLQTRSSPGMMLAVEMIASYGMAVGREVFETCVWIGRFQQAWHDPQSVRFVYRREVKLHLCNSARAKDTNVWQALVDKFGPVGTKKEPGKLYGVKSHARAALAVAVTAAEIKSARQPEQPLETPAGMQTAAPGLCTAAAQPATAPAALASAPASQPPPAAATL